MVSQSNAEAGLSDAKASRVVDVDELRKDYGLTWNAGLETGGILVGDDVTVTLDVEFVKE